MSTKMKALDKYDDVLTPDDIPKILKISRSSTYAILKSGELRSIRIAGKYRVPKIYLIEYLYGPQEEEEVVNEEKD